MSAIETFKNQVIQLFLSDMHRLERDNYAWDRFSYDGVDRSQIFDVGKHASYLDWFFTNYEAVYTAFGGLADEASRTVLLDIIRYRLSGHLHVRIDQKVRSRQDSLIRFKQAFVGEPSPLGGSGFLGSLVHYDAEWNGVRYTVDTVKDALTYLLVYGQYFLERNGVRVRPEGGDHVIDGGAFTGDSACVFSKAVGPSGHVYTFDPVKNHLDIINANVSRQGYENVTVVPYGISDRSAEGAAVSLDQYNPGWRVAGTAAPLCRIDDLVIDGRIPRVDFLKLDIEGSEMEALRGSLSTIHRFRPKLAISIYHKPDDLFEIQNFLEDQNLGYKFYVDHYTFWDEEVVLYGTCGR